MLTLGDLIEALSGKRPEWARQVITEAVIDSRQVIPGSLFVALSGQRVDGHDFVDQAFERGAHAALVQKDLSARFPTLDLRRALDGLPEAPFDPALQDLPLCLWVEDSLAALQAMARFWRRKLNLHVVGITGSVGKSTTKELVAEVLDQRYCTLKNPGNLNNEIGLPLTIAGPERRS